MRVRPVYRSGSRRATPTRRTIRPTVRHAMPRRRVTDVRSVCRARNAVSSSMRWVHFRARGGPGHQCIARPPTAAGTRDPPAPIHQVDSDRSPVQILPPPDRPGMVILRGSPTTSGTAGLAPRRPHLDRQVIVTIHDEPTDVQLRDTDELFEYRCEAHGNLRWIVVCRDPTVQHVPVRLASISPAPSNTYAPNGCRLLVASTMTSTHFDVRRAAKITSPEPQTSNRPATPPELK